jgi:hypothetical protein
VDALLASLIIVVFLDHLLVLQLEMIHASKKSIVVDVDPICHLQTRENGSLLSALHKIIVAGCYVIKVLLKLEV